MILHAEIEWWHNNGGPSNTTEARAPTSALLFDVEDAVGGNGMMHNTPMAHKALEEGKMKLYAVLHQKTKPHGNINRKLTKSRGNTASLILGKGQEGQEGLASPRAS